MWCPWLGATTTTISLAAASTQSLTMELPSQQYTNYSDIDVTTTGGGKNIAPPLSDLEDELHTAADSSTQDMEHAIRVNKLFDALALEPSKGTLIKLILKYW